MGVRFIRKSHASFALRYRPVSGQLMFDFMQASNSMYLPFLQDPF